MDDSTLDSRTLSVLTKRTGILGRLAEDPAYKRDLVDEMDHSRSTINRAIDELESVDLVRRGDEGFTATVAGRLALERLGAFRGELEDIVAAESVLAPLPFDAPIETATVAGGTATLATDPAPYRALEGFHEDLADAGRYRALLPALDDPRHVRLLYEHVVTADRPAELVVSRGVYDTLRTEFPRRMTAMAETDGFELLVGDVPPFALGVVDSPEGEKPATTAYVVVFAERGGVHGSVANASEAAIRWAEECYGAAEAEAEVRTDALFADADGGRTAVDDGAARAVIGDQLPVALEREGFVQLNVPYFRDEAVSDPATAWRAGLTLPEVHTGYAVERTIEAGDDEGSPDEVVGMTDALLEDLDAGGDHVVVGPPGSGKSTVCKRVACEWYATDRGPVLYREGGHGRPFESVEDLLVALDDVDGHALVVVEDAVRPEAEAVFEAVAALADRDDVSFLLDAREREWRDPPGDPRDPASLDVMTMPALDDADAERIVEHFERTAGESVGVPAAELRAEVGDAATATDGEGTPGEVVLLLHRLATYADPLVSGQTSLEEAVSGTFEAFADDDIALDVCVLVNVLNAAGTEVTPGALYAVADPGAFDAVDAAIEELEGRVLFPGGDDAYRTVHESWSVAFLEHLLDAEGEALAAERFGDCVSAYLSLADDPQRRDRIARHRGGDVVLPGVVDDPGEWADDAVEAVYALARERPKLASLFGPERESVALPAACSERVREAAPATLGRAFVDAGEYDRARQAFESLPADGTELEFERLLGLSQVAEEVGDVEEAIERAEDCLSLAEDRDDPELRARARRRLGWAYASAERFEEAESDLRRALDRFEALGERRGKARTLDHLGVVERRRTAYDAARQYHRRSLELCRDLGDRRGVARCHNNLGSVEMHSGNYDSARHHYERSLEFHRHVGNRRAAAKVLSNLGLVARHQGEYDDAREYHTRALTVAEDVGAPMGRARNLGNLGLLAKKQDQYERAIEYYERTLELFREIGQPHGEAKALTNLGEVAVQRGDTAAAREYVDRGADVFAEIGDRQGQAINENIRGTAAMKDSDYGAAIETFNRSIELFRAAGVDQGRGVARRNLGEAFAKRDETETARDHWRTALETFEDVGAPDDELETLELLVEACRDAGDEEEARRWCRRARDALSGAPDPVAKRHREWVSESETALEAD